MRSANDNDAITQPLPVLLMVRKDESGGDGWVAAPAPGDGGDLKRHPVRFVPPQALEQWANPRTRAKFEADFGHVSGGFTSQLLPVLGIAGAARAHDLQQVALLAKRVRGAAGLSAVASHWDSVASSVNTGLFGGGEPAIVVLWQRRDGSMLAPGLLCRNAAQALFAHALFRVSGRFGLGACRRCGNPFFALRTQQSYCSYRCRVAEAMKRYRASLKEKGHAKAGRNRKRARRRLARKSRRKRA